MSAVIDELDAVIPALAEKDQVIAKSLVANGRRWRSFTPRQTAFARDLINRARTPVGPQKVELGNFDGMLKLFQHARLRRPKIHLWTSEEGEVELTLAGSRSKFEGTINVATPGGYGNNIWFGRIQKDGDFTFSNRNKPSSSLIAIMQAFASDPLKIAAEQGKKTGRCCFCNHPLDTPKSVSLGFGPTCGKRWAATLLAEAA